MRNRLLALTMIGLTGCMASADPGMDMEPMPGEMGMTMMWSAPSFNAMSGYSGVRGSAQANSSSSSTAISVSFAGTPMAGMTHVHPWHIHEGRCGSGGAIVGDPSAYPALRPGTDGAGTASATVMVPLMMDRDYYVNIHESPDDLGTIVACGQLMHGHGG